MLQRAKLLSNDTEQLPPISFKQKRKQDAQDLAELIYDMFKEQEANAKITNGQNNAQTNEN